MFRTEHSCFLSHKERGRVCIGSDCEEQRSFQFHPDSLADGSKEITHHCPDRWTDLAKRQSAH